MSNQKLSGLEPLIAVQQASIPLVLVGHPVASDDLRHDRRAARVAKGLQPPPNTKDIPIAHAHGDTGSLAGDLIGLRNVERLNYGPPFLPV